ncbi:MAG: DUF192 domain-containing protein [Armatimonadetes bacterium]|nr:DUF192 domain-containing protein [Armatimonadota bacterium]MDE2207002.1 DUF192 domain-containing protein [Armatimonadota bacterium]
MPKASSLPIAELVELETGRVIAPRLFVATSAWSRTAGLLALPRLARGEALWLQPCNGIHTWMLSYAIDVLFLAADGATLRQQSHLAPWRFCGPVRGARVAVELPVGALHEARLDLRMHYGLRRTEGR